MEKSKILLACVAFFALILLQYASKPCEIRVVKEPTEVANLATQAVAAVPATPPAVPVPPVALVPPVVPVPVPAVAAPVTQPLAPNTCPGKDPTVYKARTPEPFVLCTHGNADMVSGSFIRHGYWFDCPSLRPVLAAIKRIVNVEGLIQVVEVGGNIGTCTWVMAAYGSHVTAFEPVPTNYALLARSTELNEPQYPNRVVAVHKGCGSSQRTMTIRSERGNMGNSVVGVNSDQVLTKLLEGRKVGWDEHEVQITTLDSEIQRHIHFLKMDCQGHETEALLGARGLLQTHGVDVIKAEFFTEFAEASGHKARELLDIFEANGYAVLSSGRVVPPETFEVFQRNKKTDIFAVKKSVVSPPDYVHFK